MPYNPQTRPDNIDDPCFYLILNSGDPNAFVKASSPNLKDLMAYADREHCFEHCYIYDDQGDLLFDRPPCHH